MKTRMKKWFRKIWYKENQTKVVENGVVVSKTVSCECRFQWRSILTLLLLLLLFGGMGFTWFGPTVTWIIVGQGMTMVSLVGSVMYFLYSES